MHLLGVVGMGKVLVELQQIIQLSRKVRTIPAKNENKINFPAHIPVLFNTTTLLFLFLITLLNNPLAEIVVGHTMPLLKLLLA